MAIAVTNVQNYGGMKGQIEQSGNLVFSGNYVAGGEVPAWQRPPGVLGNPAFVQLSGGRSDNRYQYDPTSGKILVRAAAGAEIAAAAYPAGVTGDLVQFLAKWLPRGVQR